MLTKLRVNLQMKSAEHAAAFVANPHLVFTSNIAAQALDWTVWPQFYVSSFVSFSGCNTSAIHAFVKTFRFLGLRNGVIKMRLVGTTSMGIAGVYAELPLQLPSNLADEPSINCQSSPTKGSSSKGILYPRHQNESLQLPQPPEGIIRPTAVFAHQWVVENKNLKGQLVELQAEKTTAMDDAASLRLALRHLEDHVTSIEEQLAKSTEVNVSKSLVDNSTQTLQDYEIPAIASGRVAKTQPTVLPKPVLPKKKATPAKVENTRVLRSASRK